LFANAGERAPGAAGEFASNALGCSAIRLADGGVTS
jgi:hypothetical protein